jgi:anti-sigma B factor antagonist
VRISDVHFSEHGSALVARVTGEIDLSNADDIGAVIALQMSNQARMLVLDLTAIEYLDSAGMRLIFRLQEKLRARGQTLRLVIPGASAANDALRLAGVAGAVEILETAADALRGA